MDTTTFASLLLLSAALIALLYAPHVRTGLNLSDEGYLWYGALKVLDGAVPIRDFRAYDPGRYYWCALWMRFLGRSLPALRISSLMAGTLGLAMGTGAVLLATRDWPMTLSACGLLAVSLYPPHKQVDAILSMSAACIAVLLAVDPGPAHLLVAGLFAGISLVFGLNHALYAGSGFALFIAIMLLHGEGPGFAASLSWYIGGLGLGLSPVAALYALVPGFLPAYWRRKIVPIFRRGTTNLALPIPWLWRPTPAHLMHLGRGALLVKAAYTLLPLFFCCVIAAATVLGPSSPLAWAALAASSVGLGYLHHALSRADLGHLAQASAPPLIASAVLMSGLAFGWVAIAALAALSLALLLRKGTQRQDSLSPPVECDAGGASLRVSGPLARYLTQIRTLVDLHSGPGDPVLFVPTLVTLYPLLGRQPPVYDIFCVYPATEEEERAMIDQLRVSGTRLALVHNHPLDGRDDLRFSNTHPRVWQFLHSAYMPLGTNGGLPSDHFAFLRREHRQGNPV